MYIPTAYAEDRHEVILDFIETHPFAAVVTATGDGLFATHLPLVLDRSRGAHGTLEGHFALANPHHIHAPGAAESLVIFSGPDAYVTPSWYPAKERHGRVVPTWNYVAVHAHGVLRVVANADFLPRHLEQLTERHESGREHPWAISDAPDGFVPALMHAIVGFEIEIARLEGKWKMSQNRPGDDIAGVVRGLAASGDPRDAAVARIVDARCPHDKR